MAVAFGGKASASRRVIRLTGTEETLPLPDLCGDAFGVGLDEPDALTIGVGGVYAVEYEMTARYAVGVSRLKLMLCRNGQPSPGAFAERMVSGLPGGEDDPRSSKSLDVTLRGKAFMLLAEGETISLKTGASGIGSVETCDGPNAYLTAQLLRSASANLASARIETT